MTNRKAPSFLHLLVVAALTSLSLTSTSQAQAQSSFFSLSFLKSAPTDAESPSIRDDLTIQEIPPLPELGNTIDLTSSPDNLWVRIRNGFAMTNLNDDLVLHYQQWYQNRPDALRRMVERSRPYLHHIVEELEARGMPTELALLPMVESSFNPNAYSRARASGLWQFIPATGKRFNLEQNWWRDERRDVIASTGAALDYLQTIYEMHGDWHLALASYNWGEGAVKRAIIKNEGRGLPTDYPNLTMPNETRHYVPKLQALKNIFGDPVLSARLGIPAIPNEPYFVTLETKRPIDVSTAARLAGMTLEEFQRLNPAHNRPVIAANTPIAVPADKIETFRTNLHNTTAPLTQWQAYTVTSAERLDQIAAQHGTTASELARVNGLSEKVRLGAGSTLLVPGQGLGLNNLLASAEPQHIIAPEPVVRCAKSGKKGKLVCSTSGGKSSGSSKGKDSTSDKSSDKRGDKGNSKGSSKNGKGGKEATQSDNSRGKSGGKHESSKPAKAQSANAASSSKTSKPSAATKPNAPAKSSAAAPAAKSGKGRKG